MPEILAENLSDKDVMGSDGARIGSLYNITMDLATGTLRNLVIDPDGSISQDSFEQDENGRFLVSVHRVQAVKDTVIVSR